MGTTDNRDAAGAQRHRAGRVTQAERVTRLRAALAAAEGRRRYSHGTARERATRSTKRRERIRARVRSRRSLTGRIRRLVSRLRRSERGRLSAEAHQTRTAGRLSRSEERLRASNAELRARNRELGARNEELDRFAHLASHDLRAPLRTILGFADALQPAVAGKPAAEDALQRIQRAGQRMRRLIDTLLTFARVGRLPVSREPVDLQEVARGAVEDLQERIDESRAVVEIGGLPSVRGDGVMLGQVFANLLGNAIHHAGGRPPRVRVWSEPAPAPGNQGGGGVSSVRVFFSDSGDGFDAAEAEGLFEPFRRGGGAAASGPDAGTGLGLSIVRRVIERHGGTVTAARDEGTGGARFTVELPAG